MDYLQYIGDNTVSRLKSFGYVLNLVINGLPSILRKNSNRWQNNIRVLNLVINGLPSIHIN